MTVTPDPLQQIGRALSETPHNPLVPLGEPEHIDWCDRCLAEKLLDGLRLLPDGHAAVPESVIERILGPSGPLCTGCEPCLELAQELRASLAGGRGNE